MVSSETPECQNVDISPVRRGPKMGTSEQTQFRIVTIIADFYSCERYVPLIVLVIRKIACRQQDALLIVM